MAWNSKWLNTELKKCKLNKNWAQKTKIDKQTQYAKNWAILSQMLSQLLSKNSGLWFWDFLLSFAMSDVLSNQVQLKNKKTSAKFLQKNTDHY